MREIWFQIFSQFPSIFCLSLLVHVKILVVGIWNWYIFDFSFSFQYRHTGIEIMNIVIMWYPGINERLPWEIHIKGKKLDLLMWENLGKSSFRTHSRAKGIWIKSQKIDKRLPASKVFSNFKLALKWHFLTFPACF